jgi:hypothetical protein
MHRLFFALSPTPDVRAQLERAARAVIAAGKAARGTPFTRRLCRTPASAEG